MVATLRKYQFNPLTISHFQIIQTKYENIGNMNDKWLVNYVCSLYIQLIDDK